MEKIKRYIENFQKRHKENVRFSMNLNELFDAVHYRAAQAEMKQGGAA